MKQIKLGGIVETSAIALGVMRMAGIGVENAEKVVNTALDSGISYFDHADIYGGGDSEALFGEVLKRDPSLRGRMFIQGKCGICKGYYDASYEHIMEAVEGSMKRLGVEYLDSLLLHRPDALMEPEEVAKAFCKLQEQGKVRFFGVSNENAAQMALLEKYMPGKVRVNQLQFGLGHTILVDEGMNVNIHSSYATVQSGLTLDYCRLHDITIQAWSPFQYGFFEGVFLKSEKYAKVNALLAEMGEKYGITDSAMAIAWILRHPADIQAIIGSMNPERIAQIAKAGDVKISREDWYKLYLAAGNPLP